MACSLDPESHLAWDALSPYVNPYVLGVPEALMLHTIRESCIEFCKSSGVLHDEQWIDLQKGVHEYFLETLCDFQIVRVFQVDMLNRWSVQPTVRNINRRAPNIPFNAVDTYGPSWWCGPYGFYLENVDVIKLTSGVQQDYPKGLRVEFVVVPKQDGCTLDNFLYQNYAEEISAGAIGRLKLIKDTAWYDPQGSLMFFNKFRKGVGIARAAVNRNFTSGPLYMQAQRWV